MTTTQVADDLHTTAHALNRKLQEIGIIYSQSGQWHLKMPYKKWNLVGTRTYSYQSSNGEVVTKVTLVWNQRGKRFILALYNNNFDVKQAIAEIKGDISNK
jgi:phage antirepressor YoqD-like protein